MYRLLIASVIIGILAFLVMLFIAPFAVAESDLVAAVARAALGLSNAFFENMPPGLASYINNLNLALAASTVGLSLMIGVLILLMVAWTFKQSVKGILSLLRNMKKKETPKDLPPIDLDSGFKSTGDGKKVLGRGLDSIDRD